MTEPREVHGDLDTEVFTNVVQGLGAKERADPCSLQLLQRRQFVEREDLRERYKQNYNNRRRKKEK